MAYLKYSKQQQLTCNCRNLTFVPARECGLQLNGEELIPDIVAVESYLRNGIFHKSKLVIQLRPGPRPN